MIKYFPKFSLPNRSLPVSFTPAQKPTVSYSQVLPEVSGGWTVFYPSSGAVQTRIAYIDPASGHATGLLYDYGSPVVGADPLSPASSVSGWLNPQYAMDAMYNAYGSSGSFWFLFKRNSVFNTGVILGSNIHGSWPFRGLSATYPALVDAYGSTTGNRPKITCADSPLHLLGAISVKSNVAFKSLDFHNVRRDPSHALYEYSNVVNLGEAAIHIFTSSAPTEIHVFDDVRIQYYRLAINSDGSDPIYNVFFNRCCFNNIYNLNGGDSSAVYFASAQNVEFNECVLDKLGHYPYDPSGRSPGTTRNHAFYIAGLGNDQFKFRNNIINQASYGGIQLRGGSGHLVSGNVIMRAGFAIPFGHDQNDYDDIFGNGLSMNPAIRFHQADIIKNLVMKPANLFGATGTYTLSNARGEGIGAGRINAANIYGNILLNPGNSSGNCYALSFSEFSWPWDNHLSEVLVSGNTAYNWIGSGDINGCSLLLGVDKTTQGFDYKRIPENNFKFVKNYLIEPNQSLVNTYTKGIIYNTPITYGKGTFLSSGNVFYRAATSGSYVAFNDSTSYNWGHLMNDLGDTTSAWGLNTLPVWDAPTRDDVNYISSLGLPTASGEESFILMALSNRKGSYDNRFSADPLISYISAGFTDLPDSTGGFVLGRTIFHALNYSVFHTIRRRS